MLEKIGEIKNRSKDKYADLHKKERRKNINRASPENKPSGPESLKITHEFRRILILYIN